MSSVTIDPGSGSENNADLINALLADPAVTEVVLGEGVFLIDKPIVIPSGKSLTGAGRDLTMIRAEADFVAVPGANGLVMSEMGATGVSLSDFSVDAAKLLPDGVRVNGTFMRQATDFTVERVDVYNTTGYGQFAQGDVNHLSVFASGEYTDCGTFNCQIGFEQMTCDGIVLLNCHARDGDGDLVGTYFHPLTASKNIFFIDCTGYGKGYAGFDLISNKAMPLENIVIINSSIELLGGGSAIVSSGTSPVEGLIIENSRFVAHLGLGGLLSGVTGTATNSHFQGFAIGLEIVNSVFHAVDSKALGLRDPVTAASAYGVAVHPSATLTWDGGAIEARAAPGLMYPISGQVDFTERTALVSSGYDAIVRYQENDGAIRVATGLTLDMDGLGDLAGGSLSVRYQAHPTSADQLLIIPSGEGEGGIGIADGDVIYGGLVIGHVSGGENGSTLIVTFTASVSGEAVQALIAAIAYANGSDDPYTQSRALKIAVVDGAGVTDQATVAVAVTAIDDMPVIDLIGSGPAGPAVQLVGGGAIAVAPEALLIELDVANYANVTLTVTISSGAAPGDRLTVLSQGGGIGAIEVNGDQVLYGGTVIGTLAGGSDGAALTIRLSGTASLEAVQSLVRAVAYDNGGAQQANGLRQLTFAFDNGAGSRAAAAATLLVVQADAVWRGDSADSTFTGGLGSDLFLLGDGGNDSVSGGEGDDHFYFGGSLTDGDRVDGGAGYDTVFLQGNYDLTLAPSWLAGIDQLWLAGSVGSETTRYRLISGGGLAAPGSWFTVNATGLGAGDRLEFNAASEVDVMFRVLGGAGEDLLTGGEAGDEISGGDGADRIVGLGGNDLLMGGAGDDVILAGSGDDRAFGGSGVDQILGGAGDDRIYGEAGNDTLIGDGGNDFLDGGEGDDRLYGGDDRDHLRGGNGADLLYGEAGDDQLLGDDGDDKLYGGAGIDMLYGGAGADFLQGGADADILYGEAGNDQLLGDDGDDKLYGGAGADVLYGGAGADHLRGGADEDLIFGEDGNDQLLGEDGDDKLYGGAGIDTLYGGSGVDYLRGGADNDILFGEEGSDQLLGDEGDDALYGGEGADILYGGAGADHLRGGNDGDILYGEDGNDQLLGEDGDDKLVGGAGFDTLYGGAGADHLRGGADNDILYGEDGDDHLLGDEGDDKLYGGAGIDMLYGGVGADHLRGGTEGDILFGEDGDDQLLGEDGDDKLLGGAGMDILYGGAGADTLHGGIGNDILHGEDGDDYLLGEDGDDKLFGGTGADILYGGTGADHLRGGSDGDILFGEDGDDQLLGEDGDDKLYGGAGIDTLYGGAGADHLRGGSDGDILFGEDGDDQLLGEDGDDKLDGGSGNDALYGGAGADQLRGGTGDDLLFGEDGNDKLVGGLGADRLDGGLGADVFIYSELGESTSAAADMILNFEVGQDLIDLSAIDASSTAEGNNAFTFVGASAFSGKAGELRAEFDGNSWGIEADVDGDGLADLMIRVTLPDQAQLTSTDFIL